MSEIQIRITPQQNELFEGLTAKYNIIRKGRRFGFTHGLMLYCFEQLLLGNGPILWGDTINGNIDRYYQRFLLPVSQQLGKQYFNWNSQKKEYRIINGNCNSPFDSEASIMDFRSADIPENWEGFGYKIIVLNEAGIILKNEYLYKNAVLPMLLDFPDSKLIAGGVPKGKLIKNGSEHPFYTLSKRAQQGDSDSRYKEFVFTSYDSAVAEKEDIDALVEDLGGHNHPIVRQEIYGEFVDVVDLPFLHAFSEDLHVGECVYDEFSPLYLAWDFNKESTCLLIQFDETSIRVLKEYHQKGIELICDDIRMNYKYRSVYINGDASGGSETASNETFYEIVSTGMQIPIISNSFRIPKANPRHKTSYNHCNYVFNHSKITIDKSCKGLIRDCRMVQIIQKKNDLEIDKSDQTLTHHLDPLRYHINAEHKDKLKGNKFLEDN